MRSFASLRMTEGLLFSLMAYAIVIPFSKALMSIFFGVACLCYVWLWASRLKNNCLLEDNASEESSRRRVWLGREAQTRRGPKVAPSRWSEATTGSEEVLSACHFRFPHVFPTFISTVIGTESFNACSIFSFTSAFISSSSDFSTSNTNSSCTCKSMQL